MQTQPSTLPHTRSQGPSEKGELQKSSFCLMLHGCVVSAETFGVVEK